MSTLNSLLQTNTKVIALATGAEVDSSYLWAGADKAVQSEMQGKDNGDTIWVKTTHVGKANVHRANNQGAKTAKNVKQRSCPVVIMDADLELKRNAVDNQITNEGEAVAKAKIGQKLAKGAVEDTIKEDIKSIGNIFIGSSANSGTTTFKGFQKAGAFMKSMSSSTIYGFMDWNIWGELTGNGQQSVPCNLAEARFGKDLKGSWGLIDQLRVSGDIPNVTIKNFTETHVKIAQGNAQGKGKLFLDCASGTEDVTIPAGAMFTVAGFKALDDGDNKTAKDFVFQITSQIVLDHTDSVGVELTTENSNIWAIGDVEAACDGVLPAGGAGVSVTKFGVTNTDKTYYACIMRTENAQCFGTLNECGCEGAKYSKSSIDNITVHENIESKILGDESNSGLTTFYRWDMMYASKLIEPRNAVLVLVEIA